VTRLAWLQTRAQALGAAGVLAVLAVVAAITGVRLSHEFHSSVAHCTSGCGYAIDQFLRHDSFLDRTLDLLARAMPAVVGVFWGAPLLARELESGTYRLAWTQSVSRRRWLTTKLVVGALATVLTAAALTLTVTWWNASRDAAGDTNPYALFDRRDLVPVAYALFAFTSGVLVGALVRRVVPAMAATLGLFVLARVAVTLWVRPHLLRPLHRTMDLLTHGSQVHLGIGSSNGGPVRLFVDGGGPPRSWTLSNQLLDRSGHPASSAQISAFLHAHCPNVGPPPPGGGSFRVRAPVGDPGRDCLAQVGSTFHTLVTYQPASRYWAFQWLEAGVFTGLALLAVLGCYWWVTRRIT
jgi:hypothetical protein